MPENLLLFHHSSFQTRKLKTLGLDVKKQDFNIKTPI